MLKYDSEKTAYYVMHSKFVYVVNESDKLDFNSKSCRLRSVLQNSKYKVANIRHRM